MYPNTPNQSSPSPQWQPPMPPPSSYPAPPPSAPPPYTPDPEPQLPDPKAPESTPPEPSEPRHQQKKNILRLAATALVIILLATGTYFFFLKDRIGNTGNAEQDNAATPLSSKREVALIPPADLSRYRPNPENSATRMEYVSEDGSCSLRIAVLDKKGMPGSNVNELAASHIKDLRDQGFTVTTTRDNEPALEIKDMTDSNKAYSMQTIAFDASHNGKYAATYMSAAILADDKRAHITRTCEADEKRVSQEKTAPINADAAKVMVLAK